MKDSNFGYFFVCVTDFINLLILTPKIDGAFSLIMAANFILINKAFRFNPFRILKMIVI